MRALLARDLGLLTPYWWLIVPGHVLFAANGAIGPELLFWINVALAVSYTVGLTVIDWRFEADRFVASLPAGRSQVVRSRFVGALVAGAVGTGLWVVYGSILSRVLPDSLPWHEQAGMWTTAEGMAAFFILVVGVVSVFLPLVYSLGLGRGIWAFLAVLVLAAAGIAAWVAGRSGPSGTLPSQALRETLASAVSSVGPALGWVAVLVGLAAFVGVLMRLSILGYERRDL